MAKKISKKDVNRLKRDELGRFLPLVKPSRKNAEQPKRRVIRKAIEKSSKKSTKKLAKNVASKSSKKATRKFTEKSVKRIARKPAEKPVKKTVKKTLKKIARKSAKKSTKKPAKKPPRKLPKKPVKKTVRKPTKKPAKKPTKKPAKKPPRKLPKKPVKKRKRKKEEKPLLPASSQIAEETIQSKLGSLLSILSILEPQLGMAIQSFINSDGSVDGELRISNLPEEWRERSGIQGLIATLSNAFATFKPFDKTPAIGGSFWITFGVRFGPQNEAEVGDLADLYKRFRGLFQIGTYPTQAWNNGPIQILLTGDTTGLRAMITNLLVKKGLPPSVILVRFIWSPDGSRPGHYKGEKGKDFQ